MRLMGLIYMIWPVILWIIWGGMSHLGHEGWGMDLLFVANIALTALMAAVTVFIFMLMDRF